MEKNIRTGSHKTMMTRSRGRPVKPIPVHPERVISRAVQAGLSITIELQRNIINKITRKHYESSQRTWIKNRQAYQVTKNYSYIRKAEPPVVDNNHKILFENAAKFGFTEVSRQKNSDGTVGPINQRLNSCGAALREFSHRSFLFPQPVDYGTQTYQIDQGTMEFRVAGYNASSFGPKVILAHPDLPSMDFGDAVRSHNEYIATFCAIHDVPVRETTRYSNLFLLLVRPYLEYFYSEYKTGRSGFQKGVNNALRQIKELVREAGFVPTMYEDRRISRNHDFHSPKAKLKFFDDQISEAETFYGSEHPLVTEVKRLKAGGVKRSYALDEPEEECFTTNDVEYIREKAVQRSVFSGSIYHRRIAVLFPSPWHITDVIFNGDRFAQDSRYIIVSELPVHTKSGVVKVDLVLFERTVSEDGKSVFWEPRLVLEIKTRKGQSWWVKPVFKKSEVRTVQRVVPEWPMDDLSLDDNMWNAIVNSTPRPSTQNQLNVYVRALADAFKRSTKRELGKILTGTIIVDSTSDLDRIRRSMEQLIVHAFEKMRERRRRIKRTAFEPDGNDRIALVVHEQEPPTRKDTKVVKAPWEPVYNPFRGKRNSEREFILYLSSKSQTSGGQSAAWHAKYHHGLQILHDVQTSRNATDIIWIDLADQFCDPGLAEARLRLRPRGYSEEELARVQPECIREFFESVAVRGHLDSILSFLYEDGKVPEFTLKRRRKDTHRVIVITGADTLRDATPSSHHEKLRLVMDRLLSSVPDDQKTTVVWFDSPLPSVDKALPYSSRALLPFYDDDSLSEVVTDIIWNLSVAPIGALLPDRWKLPIIGDSPMHDDIRVIVHHSPTSLSIELTHVPFLRGWSKRFRNKGSGLVVQDRRIHDVVPEKSVRDRMKLLSLTRIPWLVRLWPDETLAEDSKGTLAELFRSLDRELRRPLNRRAIRRRLLGELTRDPTILDLLRLRLPDTRDAKLYAAVTVGKINSQRLYRSPNKLLTRPLKTVPSHMQPLEVVDDEPEIDTVIGIRFEEEGDVTQPWWLVVQDPDNEARLMVGCFTHRPAATDGFLWSATSQETLTHHTLEDILALQQTIMTGSNTDIGVEVWSSRPGEDEAFDSGIIEVIGRGRSTVKHLRAFRQTLPSVVRSRPVSVTLPTEFFYDRVVDALRRYIASVTSPIPVTVSLERVKNGCQVTFTDPENGEILQTVTLDIFADLITLLRWPMRESGPMYTDSGAYVIWSVFEDIEFGELDFLKPYITYRAARLTPEELPERISQFFEETETLKVGIEHDNSVCPMVTEEQAMDHGVCWRITLPPDCPECVRQQIGKSMSGEELNGLLAPGRLYTAGRLYTFEFSQPEVSEKDESVVFHENKFIRIFLRGQGLCLKTLKPGTFLQVAGQKWYVEVSWRNRVHFEWKARSAVSGLYLSGGPRTIRLELGTGHIAREECARILNLIASEVPDNRVENLSQVEETVLSGLRVRGYSSKSSPLFELRVVESTRSVFRFGVYPEGVSADESSVDITIKAESGESVEEVLSEMDFVFEEGDLSQYNFRNKESFWKKLTVWVNRNIPDVEWTEGVEKPKQWEVTLSVDVKKNQVYWTAEDYTNDESKRELLYDDPKILLDSSVEKVEQELRETIEDDVIPKLVHISNLKDVLDKQVPEVIRELREEDE
jgi:hypothetical protein